MSGGQQLFNRAAAAERALEKAADALADALLDVYDPMFGTHPAETFEVVNEALRIRKCGAKLSFHARWRP